MEKYCKYWSDKYGKNWVVKSDKYWYGIISQQFNLKTIVEIWINLLGKIS